ncbi:MAG: nitroreductase family protein [Coriobacteriales bacterium]|nr:nitroreductase family protein [Coriobacteriales bacterium]
MVDNVMLTRHSARSFLDKPIDNSLICQVIAEAQNAPSWCNSQPRRTC